MGQRPEDMFVEVYSLSMFVWVLGAELGSAGLGGKYLTLCCFSETGPNILKAGFRLALYLKMTLNS